jgi:DNA-binding transcriptional LysR family regulator
VVPASAIRPGVGLVAVRFAGSALVRTVGLASRRDHPHSHAAMAFLDSLRHHLAAPETGFTLRSAG